MEKARAWVIEAKDKLAMRELDILEPGDYEVLFKTEVCSLCTVDRRTYKGTRNYGYPFLGGHECSGTIIKTGAGSLRQRNAVQSQKGNAETLKSGWEYTGRRLK